MIIVALQCKNIGVLQPAYLFWCSGCTPPAQVVVVTDTHTLYYDKRRPHSIRMIMSYVMIPVLFSSHCHERHDRALKYQETHENRRVFFAFTVLLVLGRMWRMWHDMGMGLSDPYFTPWVHTQNTSYTPWTHLHICLSDDPNISEGL